MPERFWGIRRSIPMVLRNVRVRIPRETGRYAAIIHAGHVLQISCAYAGDVLHV
jgi:hypothetical protein